MSDPKEPKTGVGRVVEKAKDVAGGMAGRASAKTVGSHSSAAFIESAAIGDLYEIEAAQLALQKARSPRVKEVAERMIADHTTTSHNLQSAMRMNETRGEGTIPQTLDDRRKKMVENLQAAPADKFDQTYLDQQILAHKETIDLMTGYRDSGPNPQLRSVAASAAPVVERHLRHMESLRTELAG